MLLESPDGRGCCCNALVVPVKDQHLQACTSYCHKLNCISAIIYRMHYVKVLAHSMAVELSVDIDNTILCARSPSVVLCQGYECR